MDIDHIKQRRERLREIEARDTKRFAPNPLGSGFLTRRERYNELYMQLDRRAAEWRDENGQFGVGA